MTAPYEKYPHAQNDATTRPVQSEIETAPAQYRNYQLQPPSTGNTQFDLWEYGPVIPPPPPPDSLTSFTTQDQVTPIQPLTTNNPITTDNNTQTVSLKNIFVGTSKSILYFFGMLTACFGLLCTSIAMGNVAVAIAFLLCLPVLALFTFLFYKRGYYRNTLKWQHYLWWILCPTIGAFICLIPVTIFGEQQNPDSTTSLTPAGYILFGLVFLFYGVILVITAFRKASTTNSSHMH